MSEHTERQDKETEPQPETEWGQDAYDYTWSQIKESIESIRRQAVEQYKQEQAAQLGGIS